MCSVGLHRHWKRCTRTLNIAHEMFDSVRPFRKTYARLANKFLFSIWLWPWVHGSGCVECIILRTYKESGHRFAENACDCDLIRLRMTYTYLYRASHRTQLCDCVFVRLHRVCSLAICNKFITMCVWVHAVIKIIITSAWALCVIELSRPYIVQTNEVVAGC